MDKELDSIEVIARLNRSEWIDIARGIAILIVVLGHISSNKYIYGFHMPLFFIISGWLFKEPKPIKQYAEKIVTRYLLPYFLLCFLNLIIIIIVEDNCDIIRYICGIIYSRGTTEWMPNCSPLWFLTCISIALCCFNIICKIRKPYMRIMVIITCILISYLIDYLNIPKFFWNIDTALMAIGFLEFGRILYLIDFPKRNKPVIIPPPSHMQH